MEDEDSQSIRSKRPTQKCSDLIVLGLPWKVEESDLESYFKPYGELVMVMVSGNIQLGLDYWNSIAKQVNTNTRL